MLDLLRSRRSTGGRKSATRDGAVDAIRTRDASTPFGGREQILPLDLPDPQGPPRRISQEKEGGGGDDRGIGDIEIRPHVLAPAYDDVPANPVAHGAIAQAVVQVAQDAAGQQSTRDDQTPVDVPRAAQRREEGPEHG